MEIVISNNPVEMVHPTHDQISNQIQKVILDHNHLTIIEMEIVHDNDSHEIDFETLEIT